MRRFITGSLGTMLMLTASLCLAQQVQPQQGAAGTPQGGQAGQGRMGGTSDQQIAAVLHQECQNCVQFAKYAQSKVRNEDVKELAQLVAKEHQKACETLAKFAGPLASQNREGNSGNAGAGRTNNLAQSGTTGQAGAGKQRQFDWVAIHREVGEECAAATKKTLDDTKREETDQAYLGMTFAGHKMFISQLKVLDSYAGEELRQELETLRKDVQKHADRARELMDEIKKEDSK